MKKEILLLEKWKLASELHRHQDIITWQQFSYFVTLNGVLVSALAVIWTSASRFASPMLAGILIAVFGIAISTIFAFIFGRSQMYHRLRQDQAREAECALKVNKQLVLDIYSKGLEQKITPLPVFAKVPTNDLILWLSFIVTFMWLVILLILWVLF